MKPLPQGLRISLDRSVRQWGDRLAGGSPRHILRLSAAGMRSLRELELGQAASANARLLGRRLLDAGLAHPHPAPGDPRDRVTVVIPVRDRARALARCLSALDPSLAVTVVDDGSQDGETIAAVAARHDARLMRRARSGGPAAARNAALDEIATELVAFLDSDCVPSRDWLSALVGHFDDPLVGAVAPRMRPLVKGHANAVARYLQARSPLDMGASPAAVQPGSRVAYLPSAALLVRRAAIDVGYGGHAIDTGGGHALGAGFDESLRYGEDVDLVWRLHDAGWRIRYDPSAIVAHDEPASLDAMLIRRFHYGGSAAPLSARHGRRLAPAVLHRSTVAAACLLLWASGVPRGHARGRLGKTATTLVLADALLFARRMRRHGVPISSAARWHTEAVLQTLVSLGRPGATLGIPTAMAIGLRGTLRQPSPHRALHGRGLRRTAIAALGMLAMPALLEWQRGAQLDPLRWMTLATLDDIAYAAGVWHGAIKHRIPRLLVPILTK